MNRNQKGAAARAAPSPKIIGDIALAARPPRTRGRDTARHTFDLSTQIGQADVLAKKMASLSHRNWIVWYSRDERFAFAQIRCHESVKAALLEGGTGGEFLDYRASHGDCESCSWARGVILLKWLSGRWKSRDGKF